MIHTDITVTHPTVSLGCGSWWCTFNYDSLISSALAVLVTLVVAFWIRSQLRPGEPGKVQAIYEWGYDLLRGLIKDNVSEDAVFIIPIAMTLFLYIDACVGPDRDLGGSVVQRPRTGMARLLATLH